MAGIRAASRRPNTFMERWTPVILYTALIFTLSSIPDLSAPGDFKASDKLLHVAEYFLWGILVRRALRVPGRERPAPLIAGVAGLGLAFADETFQRAVGRNYSLWDMAADGLGVLLAQAAYGFLTRRRAGEAPRPPAARATEGD